MKDSFQLIAELPTVESIQSFFNRLLHSAVKNKLKDPITSISLDEFITESVFGINSHDSISLIGFEFKLSRKKFIEIFLTIIAIRAIKSLPRYADKVILLTIPYKETYYDTAVFVIDPDGYSIKNEKLIEIIKQCEGYRFQVKQYFNYNSWLKKYETPEKINPDLLHMKKLKLYDTSILLYIREFTELKTSELQNTFRSLQDKKIYILSSLLTNPKINKKEIKLQEDCFNFMFSNLWKQTHYHIAFKKPGWLT